MTRIILMAISALSSVSLMLVGAGLIQSAQGSADAICGLVASLTGAGILTGLAWMAAHRVRA